jgi:hypothetical protein
MPCDTKFKRRQTLKQRQAEVVKVVEEVSSLLAAGKVKAVVDKKTGAIAFDGISEEKRDDVTDACIYRRIMVSGSAMAKIKLMQAEALAGRAVNKTAVAQGVHSHDGGATWHHGH